MANFVNPTVERVPVAVGVVEQTILAPTDARGEDGLLIIIENPSLTDTVTAYAWCSPDGVNQWAVEDNDQFAPIPPGKSRRMLLPSDRLWVRVLGNYALGPASLYLTVIKLRKAYRRG